MLSSKKVVPSSCTSSSGRMPSSFCGNLLVGMWVLSIFSVWRYRPWYWGGALVAGSQLHIWPLCCWVLYTGSTDLFSGVYSLSYMGNLAVYSAFPRPGPPLSNGPVAPTCSSCLPHFAAPQPLIPELYPPGLGGFQAL